MGGKDGAGCSGGYAFGASVGAGGAAGGTRPVSTAGAGL